MKKILALLLVICMLLSVTALFAGCSENDKDESRSSKKSESKDDKDKDDEKDNDKDNDKDDENADIEDEGDEENDNVVPGTKWQVTDPQELKNFTVTMEVTFVEGYEEGDVSVAEYKLDNDKMSLDGQSHNDAETIQLMRYIFGETAQAIKDSKSLFTYDEDKNSYIADGEIIYVVTVTGYETTITLKNAMVRLDESGRLARLMCEMTQSFEADGTAMLYVMETDFTFSDYGTTVTE